MTDTSTDSGHVPPPIPQAEGAPSNAGTLMAKEIEDGKAMAILCYALNFAHLPFWIVPLVMRDNEFSLYHAKQCLTVFLVMAGSAIVGGLVCFVLAFACIGFLLMPLLILALAGGGITLNIIGLINTSKGECKPLPVIGGLAESWFGGIRKKTV